jgi:hypothetical protein
VTGPLFRLFVLLGVVVVGGLILKLLSTLLAGVLPADLMRDVSAGYALLRSSTETARPAIAAIVIIVALVVVFAGFGRRR